MKIAHSLKDRLMRVWVNNRKHYVARDYFLNLLYFKIIDRDIELNNISYTLTLKGMWAAKRLSERYGVYSDVDLVRWRNKQNRLAVLNRARRSKRRK